MAKISESRNRERASLDSILDGIQAEITDYQEIPVTPPKKEKREVVTSDRTAVGYMDFARLKDVCNDEAEDMINYLVNFYLDGAILNDPYVKKRMDDDKATIADLLWNMKTSEHGIAKLMEVIDEGGAIIPRNFEVLSKLQSSKMEIVKHYEAVKTNLENNYKSMKADYDGKYGVDEGSVEGFGHKALLQELSQNMALHSEMVTKEEVIKRNSLDVIPPEEYKLPPGVVLYDNRKILEDLEEEEEENEPESEE